jgi:ABC-2 type transport system permease protein
MSEISLAIRQLQYENKAFWRNPPAAFFTVIFPLMFLVVFNLLFGDDKFTLETGQEVSSSTFYVPAIAALSVISACYVNIAIGVSFSRDNGTRAPLSTT